QPSFFPPAFGGSAVASLSLLVVLAVACSATRDEGPEGLNPDGGGGDGAGDDGGFKFKDADPGLDVDLPPLDPAKDNDGDGYLFADDCDDRNPLINPGAYDVAGDGVDNDCNGKVDDVEDCDSGLSMTSTAA